MLIDAHIYYDTQQQVNSSCLKNVRTRKYHRAEKINSNYPELELFDKDSRTLGRFKVSVLGIYDTYHQFFTWAWAISSYTKSDTIVARSLLNYSFNTNFDSKEQFVRGLLSSSRLKLDLEYLENFLAIASFLSKSDFIYFVKNEKMGRFTFICYSMKYI